MTKYKNITKDVLEMYSLTTNINECIYILRDGKMISGEFCDGIRGLDHLSLASSLNETEIDVIIKYGIVLVTPEAQEAMIPSNISKEQKNILDQLHYSTNIFK